MRSLWLPALISGALHLLLLVLFFVGWQGQTKPATQQRPAYIRAELVQFTPKATPVKPVKAVKKQPVSPVKEMQVKPNAVATKQPPVKKVAPKAEKKPSQKPATSNNKQRRDELMQALAKERMDRAQQKKQQNKAAEQQSAEDNQQVSDYTSLITARVSHHWRRPLSARHGMRVLLRIRTVPSGEVVDVGIIESSGDAAFDASAKRAVQRTQSFPEFRHMPHRLFERYFRVLNLEFKPEDLQQ